MVEIGPYAVCFNLLIGIAKTGIFPKVVAEFPEMGLYWNLFNIYESFEDILFLATR